LKFTFEKTGLEYIGFRNISTVVIMVYIESCDSICIQI